MIEPDCHKNVIIDSGDRQKAFKFKLKSENINCLSTLMRIIIKMFSEKLKLINEKNIIIFIEIELNNYEEEY